MASVETRDLTKQFGEGTPAVDRIDLLAADGEFLVLLGPSGCGKTTLLRMIGGLEPPTTGEVRIGGVDVTRLPPRARRIAMVFQSYALYPHLSVYDNIAFPLRAHHLPKAEQEQRIAWAAQILGIEMDQPGAMEIARRSRGTPRVANRLLRRCRDFAEVRAEGRITLDAAREALKMLGVDEHGLDDMDRNLMLAIIEKYNGGPVGLNTLAASLSEEEDALEEIYEPYLMQLGLIDRTPRGRVATALAYKHFGREDRRGRQPGLF